MNEVTITRSVHRTQLQQTPGLFFFRHQLAVGRELARGQLHYPRFTPRLVSIKIKSDAYGTLTMTMKFVVPTHRYKPVARCQDCDRRWGQHESWEKVR